MSSAAEIVDDRRQVAAVTQYGLGWAWRGVDGVVRRSLATRTRLSETGSPRLGRPRPSRARPKKGPAQGQGQGVRGKLGEQGQGSRSARRSRTGPGRATAAARTSTGSRYTTDSSDSDNELNDGVPPVREDDEDKKDNAAGGDDLLPPRRAGVGTSRVSALRQVLLAQASPYALRASAWRGAEEEPLLSVLDHTSGRAARGRQQGQQGQQGLGLGQQDAVRAAPDADAVLVAVPAGERHPRLIEDLKAFLGERVSAASHCNKQVVAEPSLLASAFQSKPLQRPRIMSSEDDASAAGLSGDGAPGLDSSHSSLAADCAPASPTPSAASASPDGDGDAPSPDREHGDGGRRRGSRCSAHSHRAGPTSMEDKCLECCVYYGVMCCQCTIL